jgi:anti-sigma factor RsiW
MIDLHPRPAELIASSLDRPLTADERDEVSRHVAGCQACRWLGHQLRADAAHLSVPVHVTPSGAIRAEVERRVTIPAVDAGLVRAIRVAALAAVLLTAIVVAAIGVALLQPRPTTPAETRAPEPAGFHLSDPGWQIG